jgi:hypothetical protein
MEKDKIQVLKEILIVISCAMIFSWVQEYNGLGMNIVDGSPHYSGVFKGGATTWFDLPESGLSYMVWIDRKSVGGV